MKKLFLVWSTLLLFATSGSAQVGCHHDVYMRILDIQDIGDVGYFWDKDDDACYWLPPSVYYWESWGWNYQAERVLPPYYLDDGAGSYYINAYGVVKQVYGTLPGEVDQYRFWFYYGCCGDEFCADHEHTSTIKRPEGYLILDEVNVCYLTTVWVDMASQCYPCAKEIADPSMDVKGAWWKYTGTFQANELAFYIDPSTPLDIQLDFQGLVTCTGHTIYGCDHIKD